MTGARVLRRGVVSLAAALAVALAILDGLTPVAAAAVVPQDTLAHAKSLYAAASYDEALAILDKLNPAADDATSVAEYRIFCLLALGRRDDATRAIESVLKKNPFYRPAADEVPPRIQATISDVRRQFIPTLVLSSYADAKAAYERKDPGALKQFEQVLALLEDPDAKGVAVLNDLRTVAVGFRDLSKGFVAPPAATPAPKAAAAPPPAPAAPADESSSAPPAPKGAANGATARQAGADRAAAPPAKPDTPPANATSSASIPRSAEKLVYAVEDVDVSEPVAVIQRLPVWSPVGSEVKAEFKGLLQIVIDPRGNVTSAEMRVSAHPKYDADLIRMARGWKFRPASKNGVPVAYTKLIDIMLRPSSSRDD
jgi:hypothetical protein